MAPQVDFDTKCRRLRPGRSMPFGFISLNISFSVNAVSYFDTLFDLRERVIDKNHQSGQISCVFCLSNVGRTNATGNSGKHRIVNDGDVRGSKHAYCPSVSARSRSVDAQREPWPGQVSAAKGPPGLPELRNRLPWFVTLEPLIASVRLESEKSAEVSSLPALPHQSFQNSDGGPMLSSAAGKAAILIADDDELNRELLSEILMEERYSVVCAEDGDQALDAIQRNLVDLALLDVMMPGKTGYDVCRAVKSQPETRFIPIVLVTGLSRVDERIQGITCGADDFLSKPVNRQELLARTRSLLRIKEFTDELENAEAVLFSLALSIEAKDPYTRGHCDRLSNYSAAMAERLGLPQEQRVALRRAGVVHDIGKIAVPEHVLIKSGPLTADEWVIMKQHPVIGERICAPLKSFRLVLPIIRHHHEKLDGTGYPEGLRGDQIPLTARILQVTDIYDALTTDRPYRPALPQEEALDTMRAEVKRGWWESTLVDELEALVTEPKRPIFGAEVPNGL